MDNIITVTFGAMKSVKACPAWLVDHGMILRFAGLDLPAAYEVHFSNSKTTPAKTAIGNADGVVIPDEYFHNAERIYAWLYLHTGEDDGWTAYEVEIPLRQRPEVSDVPPTPQQESAIEQAITALNAAVDQTGEDVVTTAAAVQAAEAAQEAAETAQSAAETAKTQAQTAQGKAAQAKAGAEYAAENAYLYAANAATAQAAAETAQGGAVSAKTSAETAASNASGYATAAQQSATAAANSATSASGSATAAGNSATAASGSATSASGSATAANEAKVAAQAAQAAAEAAAASIHDLTAGDVAYDDAETYPADTVGAEISGVKSALNSAYSATNPPPYPVSSVNGKTGTVSLDADDVNAVEAPSVAGTEGQVLTLDSNLVPVWEDPTGGSGGGMVEVTVSGTDPVITAATNTRYVCGECATLSFTPSATGICNVHFVSGTTATILTLPNTVKMPGWWSGTEASKTYEICIVDGVWAVVTAWA